MCRSVLLDPRRAVPFGDGILCGRGGQCVGPVGTLGGVADPVEVPPQLANVVRVLLPDASVGGARLARGQFHDVVLLPGAAAVRIARRPAAAAELPRRTELLKRLARAELPFAVPVPLSDVLTVDGLTAVALSWVDGVPAEKGTGDPGRIRQLLRSLAEVQMPSLDGVLGPPHAYCGGPRWAEVIATEIIPRLPSRWRADVERRTEDALALPDAPPSLVHGDLGGENVHYDARGSVVGVLDWDLAQPFDPAVDAACLAWHGWDTVRAAVDDLTFRRARIWWRTFGYEQLGAAVLNGEPPEIIERYVAGTIAWLTQTAEA